MVANLVNNLPATLIILPAAAAGERGPVLAMLVGVNVGPNLSYVGSLATLLWRRIMHAHDEPTDIRAFVLLGLRTVPAILLDGDRRTVVGSAGDLNAGRSCGSPRPAGRTASTPCRRDADVTLLHVAPRRRRGAAGRPPRASAHHRRPPPGPQPPRDRRARRRSRCSPMPPPGSAAAREDRGAYRGRLEHEVVAALEGADLLVLARDGERRPGPKSLLPWTRFVVDHATCKVLLV